MAKATTNTAPEVAAPDKAKRPDFVKAFPGVKVRDVVDGAPVKRPLVDADVIAWREAEGGVAAIVTIDGRRFEVAK